ncbi:MAG: beta-mannosidase [Planctomycetota bacterium]
MRKIDLNGTWEAELVGKDLCILAEVPGQVQLDLMHARKLDDPHYRMNEDACLWPGTSEWEYRRSFDVDARFLAERACVLVCEGLDTVARVSVNGVEVGAASNMFRRYVFDVKPHLQEGENRISIRFRSPVDYAAERAEDHPYPVPGSSMYHGLEMKRPFVRKSGTHFGWDWGPCTLPMGIWRPIGIEGYSEARIRYVTTQQEHHDSGEVTLKVSAFLDSPLDSKGGAAGKLGVTLAPPPGGGSAVRAGDSRDVELKPGENRFDFEIRIEKPELWWPAGYGEQKLYDLQVAFVGAKGEADRSRKRIGLRSVELVREPDEDGPAPSAGPTSDADASGPGESFFLRVNGVPVYAKGANWIPADSFTGRALPRVLRQLLTSARDANMNLVRVWGGGIYERGAFYGICDELGLLVWQDFMFACALYPADDSFLASVEAEARHQVRRLASHPCIAFWCGNNENEQALGWYKKAKENHARYVVDYSRLYIDTLGRVAAEEDPGRAYWPSSPSNGVQEWGDPQDQSRGDVHFWGVWHGGRPFEAYLKVRPRFSSEFGFQSFPSVETLSGVLGEGDWNVTSPVMEHHQRSGNGNKVIVDHISRQFRMPTSFRGFVYLSQVLQAVSIKTAVEHWRRIKPHCMGAVYWQLNDIWQGPSWSSVEYGGRWKLLNYFAKEFFAPMLVSAAEEEKGTLSVWVTSDLTREIEGRLEIALRTWAGDVVDTWKTSFQMPDLGSAPVWHGDLEEMLGDRKRDECFVTLAAEWDGGSARNVHFLSPLKRAELAKPKITTRLAERGEREFAITLETDVSAPYVTLSSGDVKGRFSANGFLILPGEEREVTFHAWQDVESRELEKALSVTSLRDSYE